MRAEYNSYEDAQLAALYNQQDRGAFEAIYDRYWGLLYIHAKKMLKDEDQAQDIVQELFYNLLRKMGQFQLKADFSSYLYQSIRYQILDLIRKQKVRTNYAATVQFYEKEGELTTDNQVLENELRRTIEQEINKLPPKMRAIFQMSRRAHLSNKEIANATHTSEENVRKQITQALRRIRARFSSFCWLQVMLVLVWLN